MTINSASTQLVPTTPRAPITSRLHHVGTLETPAARLHRGTRKAPRPQQRNNLGMVPGGRVEPPRYQVPAAFEAESSDQSGKGKDDQTVAVIQKTVTLLADNRLVVRLRSGTAQRWGAQGTAGSTPRGAGRNTTRKPINRVQRPRQRAQPDQSDYLDVRWPEAYVA